METIWSFKIYHYPSSLNSSVDIFSHEIKKHGCCLLSTILQSCWCNPRRICFTSSSDQGHNHSADHKQKLYRDICGKTAFFLYFPASIQIYLISLTWVLSSSIRMMIWSSISSICSVSIIFLEICLPWLKVVRISVSRWH